MCVNVCVCVCVCCVCVLHVRVCVVCLCVCVGVQEKTLAGCKTMNAIDGTIIHTLLLVTFGYLIKGIFRGYLRLFSFRLPVCNACPILYIYIYIYIYIYVYTYIYM